MNYYNDVIYCAFMRIYFQSQMTRTFFSEALF